MSGERLPTSTLVERLAARMRVVPDFPSAGILFQDVTPILADAELLTESIEAMSAPWRSHAITHVAGIESRGFIFAAPIAVALGAGFIPIRKPGKLPWRRASRDYELEYGTGRLEVHEDACPEHAQVLVVDDVLATGGTAAAACALLRSIGGTVAGCAFLIEISALEGRCRLDSIRAEVLLST